MNNLTYVTSNYGKKVSIEEHFQKEEIPIDYYVYDFDENSDYYVTYANTMIKDEEYTVQDWAFAFNDLRVHKRKSLPKIKEGLHYYLFLLLYFVVFFFWLRQYLGRVSYYYSPQAIYHTYLFLVSYKILDHYSH